MTQKKKNSETGLSIRNWLKNEPQIRLSWNNEKKGELILNAKKNTHHIAWKFDFKFLVILVHLLKTNFKDRHLGAPSVKLIELKCNSCLYVIAFLILFVKEAL